MADDCLNCYKKDLDLQLKDREIELLKELNKKLQTMYDEAIVLTKQAQDTADRALDKVGTLLDVRGQAIS
jgi:hypothetical protein